jgi:S-formylglutathione hydrolase FrmB
VTRAGWLAVVLALLGTPEVRAVVICRPFQLDRVNRRLHGRLIDYTRNHGRDRRIWSPALGQWRDLYVYLPPGFDPAKRYPLALLLHGFAQDETVLINSVVQPLDAAIARGALPPLIVAAPDASQRGLDCLLSAGTFFLNSRLGAFEDYLMVDVWDFLVRTYPVRPEREAHVLLGVSMGGGAAFNHALKRLDRFGVAVGVFPPLNLRWMDCRGRYRGNFDPLCWGWRTDFSRGRREVVGRFYGVFRIRFFQVYEPLFGRDNPDALALVIRENPIEMLDLYDVRPGQLEMYVAYGGRDEFNLDAQVESFLYRARQRGLGVGVGYDPRGHHDRATALRLLPGIVEWLRPRLAPYSPR